MELTNSEYGKWRKFALTITRNEDVADDLLHQVIDNMIRRGTAKEMYSKSSYVFKALKNEHLKNLDRNRYIITDFEDTETIEIDKYEQINKDAFNKFRMKIINDVVKTLSPTEIRLFDLHFLEKNSQRSIGRLIGMDHSVINNKINKIKKRIQQELEDKIKEFEYEL